MINNAHRIGSFTSSEIHRLMSDGKAKGTFGKPFHTYIEEKNMERRLGRSLTTEVSSRPTSWGNLVELQAFNLLGIDYKISSTETVQHPTIKHWAGSPDCEKFDEGKTVIDLKCPMTLKSFCQLVDCKTTDELRENHSDGDKYYYQLVSNAILTGAKFAELIVYVPYQEELAAIRELANNWEGNPNKIAWVNWAEDSDLPFLIKGRHYKNLNILRFEVSDADKKALTDRVIEAGKALEPFKEAKYAPTEEQRLSAQEKLSLMKKISERLKSRVFE
jgi:hypothetical protein